MEFFSENKINQLYQLPFHHYYKSSKYQSTYKEKSLFEPIFQEDPGHNVSVLLLLWLCQGITSWLVQEAEKKKWSRRRKKTPSPHYVLCPTHHKTFHTAPLLTCPTPFPELRPRVQVFAKFPFRDKVQHQLFGQNKFTRGLSFPMWRTVSATKHSTVTT